MFWFIVAKKFSYLFSTTYILPFFFAFILLQVARLGGRFDTAFLDYEGRIKI